MHTLVHIYTNENDFYRFLDKHGLENDADLWVQAVFNQESNVRAVVRKTLSKVKYIETKVGFPFLVKGHALLVFTRRMKEQRLSSGKAFDVPVRSTHYQTLFRHSPSILSTLDINGRITDINAAVQEQIGLTKSVIGKSGIDYVRPKDRRKSYVHFLRVLKGEAQNFTVDVLNLTGQPLPYQFTFIPLRANDMVTGLHVVGVSLFALKEAENKIMQLEYHDSLTGLSNRMLFEKSLNALTARAEQKHEKLAVIFLDIDRFKTVNDAVGHSIGDQILKLVVDRIQSQLHPSQFMARFSGDKFSIVVTGVKTRASLERFIHNIQSSFAEPLVYHNHEYFLSVSMGVSLYPEHGRTIDTLMKHADTALYSAQIQGDNSYLYYSEEMNHSLIDRFELEGYLRKALSKNEFILYYQPQVGMESGQVIGCEALIRWNHPKFGILSPAHFIPLAEEIGLIEEMGLWVLRTVCKQINQWIDKEIQYFPIAINVSAKQFLKSDFVEKIRDIIEAEAIDPHFIHLEITESATLRDIQYSIKLMNELKKLGVRVSLDDFGTGYSALSYLKDFAIDILKIDRSFIKDIKSRNQESAIVQAIIAMGQGLSMKTIAEGVETEEQLQLLKSFGCHAVQGYFYSRPLPEKEFETYILSLKNPA
ncbi:diguanylate cyclase (GGDEF)-like protein/PAS domain S-box-containing protein [Pullulanibacillus pueri]|uniref:Uncharacterized protein n=1 Tax=Pullulanibacillus pueri TaxID=1437324 RepID=A0A8J2ZZF0_9BACL|nr:EAL domain-containing protein [Pullulanibacillus pueri]MBM7680547.1 diguanylate cyclase (GGDEF)-like protein/PAS domain S-box-containing protein [Pullulanibacillus pueri]GGH88392.1 hypothetical protein GCM10007096_40620 [Pullulanibacillus pueri]